MASLPAVAATSTLDCTALTPKIQCSIALHPDVPEGDWPASSCTNSCMERTSPSGQRGEAEAPLTTSLPNPLRAGGAARVREVSDPLWSVAAWPPDPSRTSRYTLPAFSSHGRIPGRLPVQALRRPARSHCRARGRQLVAFYLIAYQPHRGQLVCLTMHFLGSFLFTHSTKGLYCTHLPDVHFISFV